MEHLLCINTNSFPANSKENAIELFMDSIQGMLQLFVEDNDRVAFYLDAEKDIALHELQLFDDFKYSDFLNFLEINNEYDLLSVLYEIEDKSPALDFFSEADIDSITQYTYFLHDAKLHSNPTVFSIADYLNAKLLSLNTSPEWNSYQLHFNRTEEGEFNEDKIVIDNISNKLHGQTLYRLYNTLDITKTCLNGIFSTHIIEWFNLLSIENQNIVFRKLSYCNEKGFRGNEPLFKPLEDAIWETRFDAFKGGTIRILYKLHDGNIVILTGFIKKSNTEGYDVNIKKAKIIYNKLFKTTEH